MTKTDDFKFDQFNEKHRAINKFFQELNNRETVVNFMMPLYHFALLDELKSEKYKDNQKAQEFKSQLEKENINIDEIKNQIPELKIDGDKIDTFDLLKKFVLHQASYYAGYNTKPPVDSIIDYGIEKLDKELKSAGWMLFFGGSFINQQIRFVYDYLASQSEKTTNKSDDKKLEKANKTAEISEIENADTKTNWQGYLSELLGYEDFVSSWKNSGFSDSEFLGNKNIISNKKLRPLQVKLINALKQVDKIEYQSLYEVVDKINLSSDDRKFIYCNIIPNIMEMITHLNKNINLPQDNFLHDEDTVHKKIYGLILHKDKKISFDDLEASFFDEIENICAYSNEIDKLMKFAYGKQINVYRLKFGLEAYSKHKMDTKDFVSIFLDENVEIGIKEKIDFANICNNAVEVLKNGGMITQDMAVDLKQQIKNATDISTLGIIWQAVVNCFEFLFSEQKVLNLAGNDPGKPSPEISIWEKLRQDRTVSNLEKPFLRLSKLSNTQTQPDHDRS